MSQLGTLALGGSRPCRKGMRVAYFASMKGRFSSVGTNLGPLKPVASIGLVGKNFGNFDCLLASIV
jgi:hypothetical protein